MIYVMSDVHGHYEKYLAFLNHVNFSDSDKLYIIGDLIDRGAYGIALLQDVMKRKNITCLKGNHEALNLRIFGELCDATSAEECQRLIFEELLDSKIGQAETLGDFCSLSVSERREIVDFIKAMPLFIELKVSNRQFILVHGGLPDFNEMLDLVYYQESELLYGPHDFNIDHFEGKTIIVGHHPTLNIRGAQPDRIYRSHDSIDIDCGLGFGGQLGVLCLDTGEEMYF